MAGFVSIPKSRTLPRIWERPWFLYLVAVRSSGDRPLDICSGSEMRHLIRLLSLTLPLWLALLPTHAADKPNFVWILSEDNSMHYLKLFQEHGAETPHIAAMAKDGLVYEHAFSNAPVCSVARTTLITGCYAPRIGTQYHRRSAMAPMPNGLRMFPAYLRDAGYHTTNNSKTDYNATPGKGVWDESSRNAAWPTDGRPFFHMRTFGNSHESSLHFSQQVMESKKPQTDLASVVLAPYHPDTPTFRYTLATYHDRIHDIDRLVGGLLADLEEGGLLEDTFVFYFGDHGGVLPGSKGYAYERGLHVPLVVRVPENWKHLVQYDRGSRIQDFVSFIDFGPTLLHLAGVKVPEGMDGTPSLGTALPPRPAEVFGYADRFDEKYDLVRTFRQGRFKYMRHYQPFNFDGLENNYRYKMLAFEEWRQLHRAGKLNAVQSQFFEARPPETLYDVEADPHETINLADRPEHQAILRMMRDRLTKQLKAWPDLSFIPEPDFVENGIADPVTYGQNHREEIAALIDISDLALVPFEQAESHIKKALASESPWKRYWGLIACSSHGAAAASMKESALKLANQDPEPLVRTRAAEFLGLTSLSDPRPIIVKALKDASSEVAANLILNSAVLLKDGKPGYTFDRFEQDAVNYSNRYINERLAYLNGDPPPPRNQGKKQRRNKKS